METILAVAGASTMLVALTYGYVGLRLAGQATGTSATARALAFFALWWLATSLNQAMGSTLYVAAAFGYTSVDIQLTYVFVQRLLLALSLVGLMYYLLYLQTGRSYLLPLIVVYALYYVTQMYVISAGGAIAVESFAWRTDLVYATPVSPAWDLASLLVVLPPVIAALATLRVYRRVGTPIRRFRVAMIGIGFVVWWVLAIAAGQRAAYDLAWL